MAKKKADRSTVSAPSNCSACFLLEEVNGFVSGVYVKDFCFHRGATLTFNPREAQRFASEEEALEAIYEAEMDTSRWKPVEHFR
jgi:hypothetical protein